MVLSSKYISLFEGRFLLYKERMFWNISDVIWMYTKMSVRRHMLYKICNSYVDEISVNGDAVLLNEKWMVP